MISAAIKLKWDGFFRKLLGGPSKRRSEQLSKVDRERERSISILQKRYGYTREKAASELDEHYSRARLG